MTTREREQMSSTDNSAVIGKYGKLAPRYDRRWSFYHQATLRETLTRLEVRPGDSLLDVGCGTGLLLDALERSVPGLKLSGVDPSPAMLGMARERLGEAVALKQGYAKRPPFPDEAFDVVVSTNAFHYFRDPAEALEGMVRVLRPTGRLVITDWCDDYLACRLCDLWLRLFDRTHFQTYGEKQCRRLLERAGLSSIRIDRYKINWLWGLMTAVSRKNAARPGAAAGGYQPV